jgi:uncharacterized membrane protein
VDNQRARTAALLLGVGLGGFIDGIVLHQIAHWHQMLSAVAPPESMQAMQRNMVADGWFHLAMWIVTLAGVLVLRSAVRGAGPIPSTRGFVGYLLIGWGGFNLVEGIALYSWLFLLVGGVGLIVLGFVLRDRLPASARVEAERRSGLDRRLNAR